MTPTQRKILFAVAFETGGILLGAAVLGLLSDARAHEALGLSATGAAIALVWSYGFNSLFEAWEARQPRTGRAFARRATHALLFEGGLTLILLPVTAWYLACGLRAALLYESSLIVFFLVYAWAFTWAFDRLVGLPESAR